MKIRSLRQGEQYVFRTLWSQYLKENADAGDVVEPCDSNLDFFESIATHYITNPKDGCVLVAFAEDRPAGVVLWGAPPGPVGLKTTLGKVANGWGTFVRKQFRGTGLSASLRRAATIHLEACGFKHIMGSVDMNNEAASWSALKFGFKPLHTVVVRELGGE